MVRLLRGDVVPYNIHTGTAHRKGGVPCLPGEVLPSREAKVCGMFLRPYRGCSNSRETPWLARL
jgi:hypothetical protein